MEVRASDQAAISYDQLPLLIISRPFRPENIVEPCKATNGFEHRLENSCCSVEHFAIVRSLAVTPMGVLPVLLLTILSAVKSWRVLSVTIYTFETACAAALSSSTTIGAGPITWLSRRRGKNGRGWVRVVAGGGVRHKVRRGSDAIRRFELRQGDAVVRFHVYGGGLYVLTSCSDVADDMFRGCGWLTLVETLSRAVEGMVLGVAWSPTGSSHVKVAADEWTDNEKE